ncbi:hypothetical protein FA048_00810 [Pedobacter polaris]|uniref:Flippase-like domain-containing protein n=1 Tax=Pedobacter polaris TaxID=2571273 RepID=A0A4V5P058_9SPHI|nr:hypothetical protein [Pedobacter polaris]TKC12192.1 hypothetical protein FA048_00810 [Pedobacter polaris]
MTTRYKKIFSILIKIAIVVFAFWFIYAKLIGHKDLKEFLVLINEMPTVQIWVVLSTVMGLMLINWGLEAFKWKRLIKPIEPINLWLAIESVFCGLTWAVFTPNRLGEYGGRVFFLSPKRRIIGVVAMAVGNIGQLVLTNVFGAIAVCIFVYRFTAIDHRLLLAVFALATAFCMFFIVFYFNIKWLNGILLAMRFTRKYKKFYSILARYKKVELFKILLFCLARYAVFSTQYFIMFLWLVPTINFLDIVMLVSILFFVQSSLPSLDLLDIGIRSITALFFFKYVTQENAAVVACIASIWLINIIIPAILGTYFVFKLNFFGGNQRT